MNKIYLVVLELFNSEENSIVNICSNRQKAEKLIEEYLNNLKENNREDNFYYHIDEVDLDSSKDILWDCYDNQEFNIKTYE